MKSEILLNCFSYPHARDVNGTVAYYNKDRINYYSSRTEYTTNMEQLGTLIENSAKYVGNGYAISVDLV